MTKGKTFALVAAEGRTVVTKAKTAFVDSGVELKMATVATEAITATERVGIKQKIMNKKQTIPRVDFFKVIVVVMDSVVELKKTYHCFGGQLSSKAPNSTV